MPIPPDTRVAGDTGHIGDHNDISDELTTLVAAVGAETTRAEAAEGTALQKASNLSDLASASTARTNLGLGTAATQASTAFDAAGTSATETSRAEAAEALLAPLASAALTGTPTAPTQTTGDSSTKIATDAFVATAVATETTRAEAAEAALVPSSDLPLSITNGGTGQTGQQAALNALTGTQSAGKFARSDGTNTTLAVIQAGDVPTLNQSTTGTAAGLSATLAVGSGGTGQATQQAAIDALTGTQSSGKVLRSDGTHATLAAIQAADVPTLNQNTTGTAVVVLSTLAVGSGGTGQATAQAAIDALAGAQTSGDYLRGNGTHVVMAAIQAADLPTGTTSTQGALQLDGDLQRHHRARHPRRRRHPGNPPTPGTSTQRRACGPAPETPPVVTGTRIETCARWT